MGAQYSIPAQNFHDSLGESFISFLRTVGYINVLLQEDVNLELGLSLKNEFPLQMLGEVLRVIIATKREELPEGLRRPLIDALVICTPQCVLL
jgi:hypothetical protein